MLLQPVFQAPFSRDEADPHPDARLQFAALCYRMVRGRCEVLLVTSRDTGRWILPKGWPIAGLSPAATAAREAFEEAGVQGEVTDDCTGLYAYTKLLTPTDAVTCMVAVYPLRVRRLLTAFPEKGQRRRKWLSPKKAAERVVEPDLQALLAGFVPAPPRVAAVATAPEAVLRPKAARRGSKRLSGGTR